MLVEVAHVLKLGVHSEAGSPSGTAWPDLARTNGAEPHTSLGSPLVNDPLLLPLALVPVSP